MTELLSLPRRREHLVLALSRSAGVAEALLQGWTSHPMHYRITRPCAVDCEGGNVSMCMRASVRAALPSSGRILRQNKRPRHMLLSPLRIPVSTHTTLPVVRLHHAHSRHCPSWPWLSKFLRVVQVVAYFMPTISACQDSCETTEKPTMSLAIHLVRVRRLEGNGSFNCAVVTA